MLNACVGIYQDSNAEKAIEALKSLQSQHALCLRDKKWAKLPAVQLVPGDVVKFATGDKVPADIRLVKLDSTTIKLDQSLLTGRRNFYLRTHFNSRRERTH